MEGTLALMIPLLALSIPIIAIWTRHQRKIAELQVASTAGLGAEQAVAAVAALEQRVRVLERIVTDKGYDVAAQIDALSDVRRAGEELQA